MQETSDKIFRSDFRETQNDNHSVIRTTFVGDRELVKVQDAELNPLAEMTLTIANGIQVLAIPLFGGVDLNRSENDFLGMGNFRVIPETTVLRNPYEEYKVHLLLFHFAIDISEQSGAINFPERNTISEFFNHKNLKGSNGVFDLRNDGNFETSTNNDKLFAYIVGGAFEFENRLLEARDSLLMTDLKTVECEALSQDAVLLLFDWKQQ